MKPDQIVAALERIEMKLISDFGRLDVIRARTSVGGNRLDSTAHLNHVLWMCQEAKLFAHTMPDKAARWLCFAQGVMWTETNSTIDEFKDDNRSES